MRHIVVASHNQGKVKEMAAGLAVLELTVLSLADFPAVPAAVETGATFAENAVIKARHYAKYCGLACLADDSGLEVDALAGAPGVYSARYAGEHADDRANNQKLLTALQGVPAGQRTARFRCVLAFLAEDGTLITADGSCEGIILEQEQGVAGFGYDPLFFLPSFTKTMAEISVAEKNAVSHRGQALNHMTMKLARYVS